MIGIFDSGIGGLTVAKAIKKVLPSYDLVYFGDTARVPYGNKSDDLIKQYALEDAKFLISKGAKIIIVACNTASSVALDYLRSNFDIPIFGVIEPAVRGALEATVNGNIGVIGTRATINSKVFEKLLKNFDLLKQNKKIDKNVNVPAFMRKQGISPVKDKMKINIFSQSAPLLVPLTEEGHLNRPETIKIIKYYISPLKMKQIDTLILGCTHYPLLKDLIQTKMKNTTLIDSAVYIAEDLRKYLSANIDIDRSLSKRKCENYYVSDLTLHTQNIVQKFLGKKINLEYVKLN